MRLKKLLIQRVETYTSIELARGQSQMNRPFSGCYFRNGEQSESWL